MSSIKGLFEVYKAKPKDEQKFVDKHVTIKHKDENGNGDDVFQASNVKTVDRKKTRMGYDANEDEKVYEDVDLDEDQITAAIVEMAEIEGVDLTEEELNELVGQINPVTTRFFKGSKKGSKSYLRGHPESPQNKKMLRLLTKTRDLIANRTNEETEVEEGYVNLAQQRAVWATRKDGGKGHPDNKKKKMKNEAVEQSDTEEKNEMAQTQLHFIGYAVKEIIEFIKMGGEVEEWYQNKLSKVHSDIESLHSYVEGEKRRTGMVKEDADQIDELSKKTLKSYIDKANTRVKDFPTPASFRKAMLSPGIAKAKLGKSYKRRPLPDVKIKATNEDVELDEVLTANTPMKTYIKDFKKSDAPQFKGKSQEKRRQMAVAAKLSAERGGKALGEDAEQIDELSKNTLASYAKKASNQAFSKGFAGGSMLTRGDMNRDEEEEKAGAKSVHKALKRVSGVNKAVSKLAKEDVINRAIERYLPEEAKYTLEERLAIKLESVPESHHEAIINLFNSLEESNQKIMLSRLSEGVGAAEILNFIIANKDV